MMLPFLTMLSGYDPSRTVPDEEPTTPRTLLAPRDNIVTCEECNGTMRVYTPWGHQDCELCNFGVPNE